VERYELDLMEKIDIIVDEVYDEGNIPEKILQISTV
jgi:hypothetical protein